jgi:DMSO/TMAO reductase YedYZ molybdopterin-dependent catalytic subunit
VGGAFVWVECEGGYTTNLRLTDVTGRRACIAFAHDDAPLEPTHGGPARLLVPHLYLWKSAKWVRPLVILDRERRGYSESFGYHDRGDPWREQRYRGD